MRTGVTVSAIAHTAIIVIALVGFNNARALTPDAVQSIAVDLVPLDAATNIRAGSEDSKVIDTKAPAVVESDKPATLAQPTGNTEEDQPKPSEAFNLHHYFMSNPSLSGRGQALKKGRRVPKLRFQRGR